MKSKLSVKQRRFLDHYLIHGNLAQAAKHAGSKGKDSQSLSATGRNLLDSLELTFQDKLNAAGLTDEFLTKKLLEGCQANKVDFATFQGEIKDERIRDDMPTRGKYLEMLSRMKGLFIDRHELTGRDGGDLVLVVHKAQKKGTKSLSFD